MARNAALLAATLATMVTVIPAAAQSPSPQSPSPQSPLPSPAWPSGDELRRSLQDIGFVFRIDHASGDWSGWSPPVSTVDPPALQLDAAGTRDAVAAFDFALLEIEQSSLEVDVTLTAFMEVAARLPIDPGDAERVRRFIVEDLLTEPPESLEACYATDWYRGYVLATIDSETGAARVQVSSSAGSLGPEVRDPSLDLADCALLVPAEVATRLGGPSTERLTISIAGSEPFGFDPVATTLQGALVTLVLTFRNDTPVEQTLTFEPPLEATTGPVAAGDVRLIVVRQLPPGDYPFHSETDPETSTGVIHIEAPTDE
jgi:hypothetical protein